MKAAAKLPFRRSSFSKSSFSSRRLLVFAILFGLIGGYIILRSFASPNPNLLGDLNNDNNVGISDLSILLGAYGTTNTNADINKDGSVTILDLSILLNHYGSTYTPPPPPPAPLPPPPPPSGGGTLNSVSKILYDMQPPNEGKPTGFGIATPALSYNLPPPGTASLEAWGQIFVDTTNTFPANVRVEVKNMESYIWSNSASKWVRMQGFLRFGGAWYAYGFKTHIPADTRVEPDGGQSVTMTAGYLYHFFPTSHAAINMSDVGGIFSTYQARLILDTPSGPNNLSQAHFVGDSGADFYPPAGTNYSFNNSFNVGVGFGRFVYLTPNWQALNFYTGGPPAVMSSGKSPAGAWSEARLQANPPPIDALGLP